MKIATAVYAIVMLAGSLPAAAAAAAPTADASTPGEILLEPSTLQALGIEWPLAGDANRNATVSLRYRRIDIGLSFGAMRDHAAAYQARQKGPHRGIRWRFGHRRANGRGSAFAQAAQYLENLALAARQRINHPYLPLRL